MFCPMPSAPTKRRPWVPLINGEALRLALARKGWTQRDLVEECARLGTKVDRGNVGRAVNGKRGSIGVRKLPTVTRALGLDDVADLLTDHGKAAAGKNAGPAT
jgi:transcriptional regulator with XRE-family HTH domain